MPFHTIERFWQVWRNSIAFWLFGIFNNFIYVVMLSAAVDILEKNHPKESSDLNTNGQVNCTEMGTGAILLADIGPSLILKFVSPLFIRRIHFHLKVFLCALFALSGFLIVSFSKSIHSSLFGVVLGSISCGLGDVTFLTMVAFFDVGVVSAWSSGTGAAGVVGALSYAAMTSLWSPEVVLRIITLAPLSLLFVYFVVLKKPRNSVFQLSSLRFTRLIRTSQFPDSSEHDIPIQQSFSEDGADSPSNRQPLLRSDDTPTVQISPSWEDKKRIFMDIFPLIFALALVYFFEYLINQALFELVYFKDAGMTQAQQYRWYQVIYQCGVFASRSSLKLFKVHRIWIMAVLQGMNFILVLMQVLRPYVVNISAFFCLIAFEGILGGLSYVNTFHRVLTLGNPNTREYSMSIAAFADSFGITCAAFAAIPLHNYLCRTINS